ncbi:MAG: GNAT family N-acetyltransferase [Bacteroidota bacterium]|nr:GNAT family N-acetyltransferase [Bacteroidota bacterium]
MKIIEITSKKEIKEFHEIPHHIYKNHPHWVCPLEKIVEDVFTPSRNVFFKHGTATRWILKNDAGELIGRVGAFINEKKAYTFNQPTGGMGFFECINNKEAAFLLFDTAKEWLQIKGMEAMDGPINFGENDNFWGLQTDGFDHKAAFGMNYNAEYYADFFEEYGFSMYFEQTTNLLNLKQDFDSRFWKIADWIRQRPGYSFRHFTYKKADKFVKDLKTVYDTAWQFHENFTPINKKDLYHSLEEAKPIIDEELIWFAYHDDEPIAFFIMYPDLNDILQHFKGKISGFGLLKFLWLKHTKTITRSRVTIMGVIPKYQKMGVESGIFWHVFDNLKQKPQYKEVELSWVGDFNPKMRKLHESLGATFWNKHITYRYLFNTQKTTKRSTIIAIDTKEQAMKNKS